MKTKNLLIILILILLCLSILCFWKYDKIILLINALPQVLLGAIIAAIVALISSFIQMFTTVFALEKRIEFEQKDKLIERETNIKREIYLKAMEDFNDINKCIMNLSNANIGMAEISSYINKPYVNLSKVELLSSKPTCKCLRNVLNKFYIIVIDYIPKRKPMDECVALINSLEKEKEFCQLRHNEIISNMNNENSTEFVSYLDKQCKDNMKKWDNILLEIDNTKSKLLMLGMSLQEELTQVYFDYNKIIDDCKKCIRNELNLHTENNFDDEEKKELDKEMLDKIRQLQSTIKTWIHK